MDLIKIFYDVSDLRNDFLDPKVVNKHKDTLFDFKKKLLTIGSLRSIMTHGDHLGFLDVQKLKKMPTYFFDIYIMHGITNEPTL